MRQTYSCQILMKLEFAQQFFEKKLQISNFMKIRPVEAEMFHMDRHDEADSVFRNFAKAPNKKWCKKGNCKRRDCDRLRCSGLGLVLKLADIVHCYSKFKTQINPCYNTRTYIPTPNDPLSAETMLKKEEEALCSNICV